MASEEPDMLAPLPRGNWQWVEPVHCFETCHRGFNDTESQEPVLPPNSAGFQSIKIEQTGRPIRPYSMTFAKPTSLRT